MHKRVFCYMTMVNFTGFEPVLTKSFHGLFYWNIIIRAKMVEPLRGLEPRAS